MCFNDIRLNIMLGVMCCWAIPGVASEPAGAGEKPPPQAEGKDATDLVKSVEVEWSARCEKLGPLDPKLALGLWGVQLRAVIGERVAKEQMHGFMLAATADGPGAALTGYHRSAVIEALVDIFSRAGERAELVEMLSRDFPRRMYYSDVEFWLAFKARKTLPDGIEVLFDAFDRSKDAEVREKIAGSVGRAFRANGLDFGKNKTTVDACRSWYAKNKGKIEPSIGYGDNIMHGQRNYAKRGLFVSSSTDQRETEGQKVESRKAPAKTAAE
jgi:hypothetical protein